MLVLVLVVMNGLLRFVWIIVWRRCRFIMLIVLILSMRLSVMVFV